MTRQLLTAEGEQALFLQALRKETIGEAVALCDACVGKNMYSPEALEKAIEHQDGFFYLLETPQGEAVGYLYAYLTRPESIAANAKLNEQVFLEACPSRRAGQIKSVGLKKEYRSLGISERMVRFALDRLRAMGAEAVFVICWKIGDLVPLSGALKKNGFAFLAEAYKVWYDHEDLVCPVCHGRCVCDAAVYYQK